MEVLKQPQYTPYSANRQIIELFAAKNRYLENVGLKNIRRCLDELYRIIDIQYHDILDELDNKKIISEELNKKINTVISEFMENYK